MAKKIWWLREKAFRRGVGGGKCWWWVYIVFTLCSLLFPFFQVALQQSAKPWYQKNKSWTRTNPTSKIQTLICHSCSKNYRQLEQQWLNQETMHKHNMGKMVLTHWGVYINIPLNMEKLPGHDPLNIYSPTDDPSTQPSPNSCRFLKGKKELIRKRLILEWVWCFLSL